MSNVSLLTLPIELLHRVFDYLDVQTILDSFRGVCTQLAAVVNTYNRFELDFNSISKSDCERISHLIRPDSVISLILSDNDSESTQISLFLSSFNIRQFTKLRSLTLYYIDYTEMRQFLQHISTCSLVSLSIDYYEDQNNETSECRRRRAANEMKALLSSIIAKCTLRKLRLKGFDNIIKDISWPVPAALNHLTLDTCTYNQYRAILHRSPHLRSFVMRDCKMNHTDETVLSSSGSACYAQLTSLSIRNCKMPIQDLRLLLSLTPSLVHLKLISYQTTFNPKANDYNWEQFIRSQLPHLDEFEFLFSNSVRGSDDITSLDSLIAPFQTPFWLDDKRWFVTCDYVFRSSEIRLYTTTMAPITESNTGGSIRWETTSMDSVCRLTKAKVCVKFCLTTEIIFVFCQPKFRAE